MTLQHDLPWEERAGHIKRIRAGVDPDGHDVTILLAIVDDLTSRIGCIVEATYWDRPYDERLNTVRGMCDLTTNGMTADGPKLRPPIPVGDAAHMHGDWIIDNTKCPFEECPVRQTTTEET